MSSKTQINLSLDVKIEIQNTEIRAASTIFNDNFLQNAIWFKQGNFSFCLTLERDDTENLINTLTQHLANIKSNEIELLAQQTKAAA